MPSFEIALERNAIKALRKASASVRQRLTTAIDALADDPRPHGCTTLDAKKKVYRIRVRDHRVIYQVRDSELIVLVVRIADRRDVYDRLNDLLKGLDPPK